jgi:hypothetical protein
VLKRSADGSELASTSDDGHAGGAFEAVTGRAGGVEATAAARDAPPRHEAVEGSAAAEDDAPQPTGTTIHAEVPEV